MKLIECKAKKKKKKDSQRMITKCTQTPTQIHRNLKTKQNNNQPNNSKTISLRISSNRNFAESSFLNASPKNFLDWHGLTMKN